MKQFDLDFAVRMGKGTILVVLTEFFVDVALAVLGLVPRGMVELLYFVVGRSTGSILAMGFTALHVRVGHLAGVAPAVAFVVVVVAAGKFMHVRDLLTMRTEFSFKSLQLEPEELVTGEQFGLAAVKKIAVDSHSAGVVIALRRFIAKGVIK